MAPSREMFAMRIGYRPLRPEKTGSEILLRPPARGGTALLRCSFATSRSISTLLRKKESIARDGSPPAIDWRESLLSILSGGLSQSFLGLFNVFQREFAGLY